MGRLPLALLVLTCALSAARADEKPAPKATRLTPPEVAAKVLEAHEAGDAEAIAALGKLTGFDPWLVVDGILARGQSPAAAAAYVAALPAWRHAALEAYLAGPGGSQVAEDAGKAHEAVYAAMRSKAWQRVLDLTATAPPSWLKTISGLALQGARGVALLRLHRHPEGARVLHEAGAAAEKLGWRLRAVGLFREAGAALYAAGRYAESEAEYRHCLELAKAIGDRTNEGTALAGIGLAYFARGQTKQAIKLFEQSLEIRQAIGDAIGSALLIENIGSAHANAGDDRTALKHYERALEVYERHGHQRGLAQVLGNLGTVYGALGDHERSLATLRRALDLKVQLGDLRGQARTLGNIGIELKDLSRYDEALEAQRRSAELAEKTGDPNNLARTLSNWGKLHAFLGRTEEGLRLLERGLKIRESIGDLRGIAFTLSQIGSLYWARGMYPKALAHHRRALGLHEKLENAQGVANSLIDISTVEHDLGNYADALRLLERSAALAREKGYHPTLAVVLGNFGVIYESLGDLERSLGYMQQAMEACEKAGDRVGVATALSNIGQTLQKLERSEEGLPYLERALEQFRHLEYPAGIADALHNLGKLHGTLGDHARALDLFQQAYERRRALGDRDGALIAQGNVGVTQWELGLRAEAISTTRKSIRTARRLRAVPQEIAGLRELAIMLVHDDKPAQALMTAQQAIPLLDRVLSGFGESEAALARSQYAWLLEAGTLAAVQLEDPAEMLTFLETGRAGAQLEALGGRQAMRWADLSPDLRAAEKEANEAIAAARRAYGQAVAEGKRRTILRGRKALDEALDRATEVAGRIQREAKQLAGVFYPRAATLEEVQGWLEPGDAMVVYGFCLEQAAALVLTPEAERIVRLPPADDVRVAVRSLAAHDEGEDAAPALKQLKRILVDALHLSEEVRRVLVSPQGLLAYVPYGAIFDRAVCLVPSATTFALLAEEEREPGSGVLALGDPDYGTATGSGKAALYAQGRRLAPLPGSAQEVAQIGDEILVGAEATEEGLRDAIGRRPRWRAVHFACHGLVDRERPAYSALALTPGEQSDGLLTCGEILRLEVPADLAVLSACETGKGKVVKGEGIVGLTRAFMFAGAPRVICSLWKVDDEATRALMVKFYELWNPPDGEGLGAAEALKAAQAFVRGHEKWKHPYYWAAWVLWGLPQ